MFALLFHKRIIHNLSQLKLSYQVLHAAVAFDFVAIGTWQLQIFGHANKKLNAGRGVAGKVAIVGAKDRATNSVKTQAVDSTSKTKLHAFINNSV